LLGVTVVDSLWWLLVVLSYPVPGSEVVEFDFRSLDVLVVVVGAGGGASTGACATCATVGTGTYVVVSLVVLVVPQALTSTTSDSPATPIRMR